jgi:hypothetical protein
MRPRGRWRAFRPKIHCDRQHGSGAGRTDSDSVKHRSEHRQSAGRWRLGLASAEIYDPSTGVFSSTGALAVGRSGHGGVTYCNDETVLVVGGSDASSNTLATSGLFNSTSGTVAGTGGLQTPRAGHTATPFKDGTVLATGGVNIGGSVSVKSILYGRGCRGTLRSGNLVRGKDENLKPQKQVQDRGVKPQLQRHCALKHAAVFFGASATYDCSTKPRHD